MTACGCGCATLNRSHRKYRIVAAKVLRHAKINGLPCALCGRPIIWTAKLFSPWSPVSDHVTPISLGGCLLDPANQQAAHRYCNGSKGAGTSIKTPPAPTPLRRSENW